MTKHVKYKGPQVVDDEVFAEIEGVLARLIRQRAPERLASVV